MWRLQKYRLQKYRLQKYRLQKHRLQKHRLQKYRLQKHRLQKHRLQKHRLQKHRLPNQWKPVPITFQTGFQNKWWKAREVRKVNLDSPASLANIARSPIGNPRLIVFARSTFCMGYRLSGPFTPYRGWSLKGLNISGSLWA